MDPDEGGGTPPRRSHRIQNLDPLPFIPPNNDNNVVPMPTTARNDTPSTVQLEEASMSQYHNKITTNPNPIAPNFNSTNYLFHGPVNDDNSTIASTLILPPLPSSSSTNDLPEETFRISPATNSSPNHHSDAHQNCLLLMQSLSPSIHHTPTIPPHMIQLQPLQHNTNISQANRPPSLTSTITPVQSHVSATQFNQLQSTMLQLQHDMNTFQCTVAHQTTDIHQDMAQINCQLQATRDDMRNAVTTAIVEAMKSLQLPYSANQQPHNFIMFGSHVV